MMAAQALACVLLVALFSMHAIISYSYSLRAISPSIPFLVVTVRLKIGAGPVGYRSEFQLQTQLRRARRYCRRCSCRRRCNPSFHQNLTANSRLRSPIPVISLQEKKNTMSQTTYNPLIAGIDEIRGSWGWFLFLGILFIALGAACIAFNITATFTTVLVFGWLLLIGGVVALIQSFTTGTWGGFFLNLLTALLRGFTGYLLVRYPLMGAETLTVVLASFFIVGGLFRAIGSGMAKFPSWGWAVFSGVVSVALGVMVLWQMPITGLFFIGLAIGVDLIVDGVAMTFFASAIHHLPKGTVFEAA
jgi:uncharacterized membrane protein HdeD (DUF308 family)